MKRHSFLIATGPEMRRQYFALRAREYQRTFGFDGAWLEVEDAFDRAGVIVVCVENDSGLVIAGARMNFCAATESASLPMEHDSFSLPRLLPGMNLGQRNYAEVSRLAVVEEHQKSLLLLELLDALQQQARLRSTPLVFSICPRPQARNYRKLQRLGYMKQPFYILEDVPVPPQFDIEMRLCLFAEEGEY